MEYVFIRILEACNADCFMCAYRLSKDRYRFGTEEMAHLLRAARHEGVKHIRLTGGEPLAHRDTPEFISMIRASGIRSSIITNGLLLERFLPTLAERGLNQLIVSIDGTEQTHDAIRGRTGIYRAAIAALKKATTYPGLLCRVNTVVGPDNFREMKALQNILTDIGVQQWELSSLKLERRLDYTAQDRIDMDKVVDEVFRQGRNEGKLIPLGKVWCGETDEEKNRYFEEGITPRADSLCRLVDNVRYIDAKNRKMFCCSLISHRPRNLSYGVDISFDEAFSFQSAGMRQQTDYYRHQGPQLCTGCSTTASGFSNRMATAAAAEPWSF